MSGNTRGRVHYADEAQWLSNLTKSVDVLFSNFIQQRRGFIKSIKTLSGLLPGTRFSLYDFIERHVIL